MSGFDDLADRLDGIAEELADLALDRLRAVLEDDGADAAAAEERRLTKARRRISEAICRSFSGGCSASGSNAISARRDASLIARARRVRAGRTAGRRC